MPKKTTTRSVSRSEFNKLRHDVATVTETVKQLAVTLRAVEAIAQGNFRRCAEVQAALDRLIRKLNLL
jgi:hypothetical protein